MSLIRLFAEERTHTGIIISSQEYSIGEQMRRVLKLMATKSAEEMVNQLVFLSYCLQITHWIPFGLEGGYEQHGLRSANPSYK